jgi:homoserine O-acetyltransferase/O-succinyltransferase
MWASRVQRDRKYPQVTSPSEPSMLKPILIAALLTITAAAQTAPTYTGNPGDYIAHDFHFGSGQSLPDLKLHYLTLGTPHRDASGHVDNAVLLLHGTGGDAHSLFSPVFSNVLFGPGQPLDITHYFLIFPDDIGHGDSSKPSDGLRMNFPQYDYDDMVRSQHQMLLDGLHVDHLRLILGTSMGCMQSFVWGETYPGFSDALMPLACLPVQLAGRNRMMRYMAIENIERDPVWNKGNYTTEPIEGLRAANELLLIMGSAPLVMQKADPTRQQAEAYTDKTLDRLTATTDANNMVYYFDASRNYDPSQHLDRITVPVMWINSADDFINPPELGIAEKMVHTMPNAQFVLIPISDKTRGHGTHTQAAIWQNYLIQLLNESAPQH